VRETTLQTPRSVKREGEEVLQMPEQRFPCSPWSPCAAQGEEGREYGSQAEPGKKGGVRGRGF